MSEGRSPLRSRARRSDPRAVWLRSLAWSETATGDWTGAIVGTSGGRFTPMPLEEAFEVAIRRCVLDDALRVEISSGRARIASSWHDITATADA